jgi:hypothetical protein
VIPDLNSEIGNSKSEMVMGKGRNREVVMERFDFPLLFSLPPWLTSLELTLVACFGPASDDLF